MQRVQAALVTSLLLNLSPVAVSLSEMLSGVCNEEEEEGSSRYGMDFLIVIYSGVRRRRKRR